jgi:hypothetical protein
MTSTETNDQLDQPAHLEATLQAAGLSISCEFVPFSRSRNAAEKLPSLNWRVTVYMLSGVVLTTDYGQGSAYAPSYKPTFTSRRTLADQDRDLMVAWECETGGHAIGVRHTGTVEAYGSLSKKVSPPTAADVLYSLLSDASAIDSPTYEDWADDYGYDRDSRKGEAIYRACIEIGLKLRAALGEPLLSELRDATQDY